MRVTGRGESLECGVQSAHPEALWHERHCLRHRVSAPLRFHERLHTDAVGASQTVSELFAIGALGIVYTLRVDAFGSGVWVSARRNRPLCIVGALKVASGIIGLGWSPMHQRAVGRFRQNLSANSQDRAERFRNDFIGRGHGKMRRCPGESCHSLHP
jgi:hypothetical protein